MILKEESQLSSHLLSCRTSLYSESKTLRKCKKCRHAEDETYASFSDTGTT